MKPLTAEQIRSSIVNASAAEIERMQLPGLHEVVWEEREFLGWRDPQGSQRGYIVAWVDDRPVGIVVRAASNSLRPGIGAICSLCHTPQPATQVLMFSAARGGESGREGNSIGTYICADLACPIMIRIFPGQSEMLLMRDELIARRSDGLQIRVGRFTERILETA
ncbi:FBP domain-containing protein [Microcella daejeonensis]|uniref:FBP domain-containing protein n=1 Tax=Microcella daejeonensis TaxID=2994971 RepID=A0A9E8MJM6_9MICO|nr:FBP domain-containing protein [Microcella daejeonensis]WAB80757.1 FBP domain-containing protein [Microcella daejeonensis]